MRLSSTSDAGQPVPGGSADGHPAWRLPRSQMGADDRRVMALRAVVPSRYLAAIDLGAGQGLRLGEVLAFEDGPRCLDPDTGEVHVVQQLRFHTAVYGGFYLSPPKSGSIG